MELHFTPEQEAELVRIAAIAGAKPEDLVRQAAMRLLDEERTFHQALEKGIAQIDRGEFIEEEDMDARVERMIRS